jgi:FkbM family methyltransferase
MEIVALGRSWSWPEADTKCRKVAFDWAKDLNIAYKHCKKFDLAVQAGGNMGVWPWLMSQRFKKLLTFEPDPICFDHLASNLADTDPETVLVYNCALLDKVDLCEVKNDKPDNLGAQYVVRGRGKILATTIDLQVRDHKACDLVYLDIEGAELLALRGAVQTLKQFHPVVVVEDNGLSERYGSAKGDVEKWLAKDFGYKVVARPHRDVVLA